MQCSYQVFVLLGGLVHQIWCEGNVAACWRTYFSNLFSLFNQLTKISGGFCSSSMCWIHHIISAQLTINQNSNAQAQLFISKEEDREQGKFSLKLHETLHSITTKSRYTLFCSHMYLSWFVLAFTKYMRWGIIKCFNYRHIFRFLNFNIIYLLGVICDFWLMTPQYRV